MLSLLHLLLAAVLLVCSTPVSATQYYVSQQHGSDSNSGTSTSAPWATLSNVNGGSFNYGDQINFCQGDRYEGTTLDVNVNSNSQYTTNVVYTSYNCDSSTAQPVFTASLTLEGVSWSAVNQAVNGNGLLQANVASMTDVSAGVNSVWVNGQRFILGRYPNLITPTITYGQVGEFITNTEGSSNYDLSFAALSAPNLPTDFTGHRIQMRVSNYQYQTSHVASYTAGTSTSSLAVTDPIQTEQVGGFYFQHNSGNSDSIDFYVDSAGEYAYDSTNQVLYVYPYDSTTYSDLLSGAASAQVLFNEDNPADALLQGSSHVTIENLAFTQSGNGLNSQGGSQWTFQQNTVSSMTARCIYQPNGNDNIQILSNTISDCEYSCIHMFNFNGGSIQNNVVTNCGMGTHISATQYGNGIAAGGALISGNVVTNSGYIGINPSQGAIVSNNQIINSLLVLNDGAAIYTSGGGYQNIVIYDNYINNVVGNYVSWYAWNLAPCIFADQGAAGVTIANNVCDVAPMCIKIFDNSNALILSNNCLVPGLYLIGGSENSFIGNKVATTGTNDDLQNPIVLAIVDNFPSLTTGYVTILYNAYCLEAEPSDQGNYVFQSDTPTDQGARYNNLHQWVAPELTLGNYLFEYATTWTTSDCSNVQPYNLWGNGAPTAEYYTLKSQFSLPDTGLDYKSSQSSTINPNIAVAVGVVAAILAIAFVVTAAACYVRTKRVAVPSVVSAADKPVVLIPLSQFSQSSPLDSSVSHVSIEFPGNEYSQNNVEEETIVA